MNLDQQLKELKQEFEKLTASSTIPYDVEQAFRTRLDDLSLKVSSKSSSSENQAVNEGGGASYNVLKNPDGFLELQKDSQVYYIPYFS